MNGILSPDTLLDPTLAAGAQAFVRAAYGVLLLATLVQAFPQRARFFRSERWGGYAQSSPLVDAILSPPVSSFVLAVWIGSALLLVVGVAAVWAALVNLVLARFFFIHMRWKSVLRGMGAPGFMTYWLGGAVCLLELSRAVAPSVRPLALLVLQVDFSFIMFSAGVYKLTAGYALNHGMEYGLVNPEWGYWWRAYRRLSTDHWLLRILNHLAWGTEVVGAVLMVVPATRFVGGLLILVSFAFIASQIRLGFLCEMVMVSACLFFHAGSPGGNVVDALTRQVVVPASVVEWTGVAVLLKAALWTYLALLPIAHGGLFHNFYARRRLPSPLQTILDRYANAFGLIIWRVFSVDVVNFFVLIHRQQVGHPETRILLSRYGWRGGFRFSHVGESIAITSVFTTLKYYPSNSALFTGRLLRYARTLDCQSGSELVFEYVSILKENGAFGEQPVAEYVVDPLNGTVREHVLDATRSVRTAHAVSPVHEGVQPGTYVPARSQATAMSTSHASRTTRW